MSKWPDTLPSPEYRDIYIGRSAKYGTGTAAMAREPDPLDEHWKILESLYGFDDHGWR